jgi:hypothetical protein
MSTGNGVFTGLFDIALRGGEPSPGPAVMLPQTIEKARPYAAANPCVSALNRFLVKREKQMPEAFAVAR